jgi:hypothetical protein
MRAGTVPGPGAGARADGRARAAVAALAAALLGAALGCATPAPSAPAPEPGTRADFDAPRPAQVGSFLLVSQHRESRGDLEGALRAAEQAREAGPSSAAAALREAELRAAVARRAGDAVGLEEARAAILRLAEEHPDAPAARLARARLELADGREQEAAALARELAAERPGWAAPHGVLARALLRDDPREALAAAEQAAALAPADPDALSARAAARAAHALDAAAAADARRALRIRPDPAVTATLARVLLRSGDARAAASAAESVLAAERGVALELTLARAALLLARREAAQAALRRAEERAAGDAELEADVLEVALDVARAEGHGAAALAEIEAARRVRPDDGRLAELAARAELVEGRTVQAEASARQAVLLAPERVSAWHLLAESLERQGVRPPARERARAALGAGADDARVDVLAGLLAERAGDTGSAAASYETAVARDPALAVAALRLARVLALEERDPARAVELAQRALGELGFGFESGRVLGRALLAGGRPAEAVSAYRAALGALPLLGVDSEPVQLSLALALAQDGQQAEAKRLAAALVDAGSRRDPAPPWLADARALRERLVSPPAASGAPSR